MIGLLIGIFLGVCATLLLYSTIAGERINNLEYQNEVLMNWNKRKRTCKHTNVCMLVLMKGLRS